MNRTTRVAIAACLIILPLAGCHISRPADPARRAIAPLPAPGDWPARDTGAIRDLSEATPEKVYFWQLNGKVEPGELDEESRLLLETPDRTILANRMTERGLLRVWESTRAGYSFLSRLFGSGFDENATFLSPRTGAGYARERALMNVPDRSSVPRGETSFRPGLEMSYTGRQILLDRGLELGIPKRSRGKGVLVVLGGLFSTTWQESSIELFKKAGWDIIQLDPTTTILNPNYAEWKAVRDRQSDWRSEESRKRIVQERAAMDAADDAAGRPRTVRPLKSPQIEEIMATIAASEEKFPTPPTGWELTPETDPEQLGKAIARAMDETVAENAYAAAAALDYFVDTHGADAVGPIAVIGYSAGTFAAPAVAARIMADGHPVHALIMIGGGADLFGISQQSSITDGGVDLTGEDKYAPETDRLDAVHASYLEHAKLDPYTLGPALADIPTLIMIAEDDNAVPNGTLLDERFRRPHRIRYFGGHEGLFYFLPPQTPRMIRWLDEVTQADE